MTCSFKLFVLAPCQSLLSGVKRNETIENLAARKKYEIYLIILKSINVEGGYQKLRVWLGVFGEKSILLILSFKYREKGCRLP